MTNPKTVTKWLNRREETIDLGGEWSDENKRVLLELARHMVKLKYIVDALRPSYINRHREKVMESCQKTISKIEGE